MTVKSVQRRARLAAALESAVDGEFITLDEMMVLWGVSKGTLVNTLNVIPFFPAVDHVGARNRVFYPSRAAIDALLRWETRGDEVNADKNRRLNAMMGVEVADTSTQISISEMAKASALRAEVEQRMASQGELLHRQAAAAVASAVFEMMSRNLSNLGSVCDPNGRWDPDVREAVDKAGKSLLLRIHAKMADTLAGDEGPDRSRGDKPARAGDRTARAPRVSVPAGSGVAKPARAVKARAIGVDKPVGGRGAVRKK